MKSYPDHHGNLPGDNRGKGSRCAAHPNRLLVFYFMRKVDRLFQSPGRHKLGDFRGTDVGGKLFSLELRPDKVLPLLGYLVRRNEILIVRDNRKPARERHDIAVY